jgi:hypothetical protein
MDKKHYGSDSLGGSPLARRRILKSLGLAAAGAAVGGPLSLRGRLAPPPGY